MSIARKSIQQQAAAEQAKVQSWQQQQHRDIDRQAEELRRKQREEASKAEQQAQAEIAKAEKAVATARKQRALGVEPDLAGLKANKEKAIESQKQELSKAKEAKTELQKAEKEARAEVETIAKEATTELEAQQRLAMAEVAKLEKDNVELDNGEWIDKETYNSLSPEDQAMINKLGVEKFNRYKQKEFESNNVKLSDGSWISLETYNSLPPEQQNILRTQGIAGYEKWQQEQIAASNADSWKALQDLITATGISSSVTQEQWNNMTPEEKQNTYDYLLEQYTVTVGNDEIVSKGWYEDLNPEFQAIVAEGGTTALDEYIADNYVTTDNEELIDKDYYNSLTDEQKDYILRNGSDKFQQKYFVTTDNEELIDKDYYNSLTDEQKNYILRNGSDKFQQKYFVKLSSTQELIDKKEYEALPPEVQKMLQEKGITETNNYIEKQKKEFEDKYVKLDNGDYIDKDEYYKMTPQDQALLRTLGIAAYNAKKQEEFKKAQEDYIKTLPKEAQDYIKLVGFERFNEAYHNALKEQEAGRSPDGQLKTIGLVPNYAENVTIDKDGVISYEGTPNFKAARVIDLEKLDFNNLSEQDYFDVLKTVISNSEGKETKLDLWQIATHYNEYKQYFKTLSKEQKAAMEKVAKKYAANKFINVLSFVFPPAQALKPEVTIKDIKGTEWAIGFANVALLFVPPAGAIGKAGSAVAKVASIASKAIQAAAMTTYTAVLAKEWENMDIKEQAISVALSVGILGAIYGKPLPKGLKSIASKTSKTSAAFGKTPAIIKELAKAAKAKDVNGIRAAATKLEQAGSKIKGINGTIVRQQARAISINAEALTKLKGNALKNIQKLNKDIAKAVKTGASGQLPANDKLRDAANKIVEQTRKMDDEIRRIKVTEMSVTRGEYLLQQLEEQTKRSQIRKTFDIINKAVEENKALKSLRIEQAAKGAESATSRAATTRQQFASSLSQLSDSEWAALAKKISTQKELNKIKLKLWQEQQKAIEAKDLKELMPKQTTSGLTQAEIFELNSTKVKEQLQKLQKMQADKALKQMLEQNMVTVALAVNANAALKILFNANQQLRNKALEVVSPKIAEIIKVAGSKPTVKIINYIATKVQPIAKVEVSQAINTAINQQVASITLDIVKTTTDVDTETDIENAVTTYIKTIELPAVKEAVKVKQADIVKSILATKTKPVDKVKTTKPFKPIIIKDENGKEGETPTPEQLAAAVGWKQGWAYWYIYPPAYGKGGKCRIIRKTPIKSIPLFKDAKSAYLSLTKIGKGELPETIKIPMGITDLIIRTAKGGKPKSQYKRKAASSIPRLRTTK